LLPQACAHWGKFLAAASRRSLGRISVPVWLVVLTDQLPVIGSVGRYPADYLMGRRPLRPRRKAFFLACARTVCGISAAFAELSPTVGQVSTCSSAVRHSPTEVDACDLHALGTPPAFVLSQDQTLHVLVYADPSDRRHRTDLTLLLVRCRRRAAGQIKTSTPGAVLACSCRVVTVYPEVKRAPYVCAGGL
jgi:hypothetical protein